MTEQEIMEFAERFVGYVQAGDGEAMRSCYAPGAKIWHNTDNIEQTIDDNIKVLNWFVLPKSIWACTMPPTAPRL